MGEPFHSIPPNDPGHIMQVSCWCKPLGVLHEDGLLIVHWRRPWWKRWLRKMRRNGQ